MSVGGGVKRHVMLVVLGDIKRSPRMLHHAKSLLENDFRVTLLGYYRRSEILPEYLIESPDIRVGVVPFAKIPYILSFINFLPSFLHYVFKAIFLSFTLAYTLFVSLFFSSGGFPNRPINRYVDSVIVQNPPAIPTLAVSYVMIKMYNLLQSLFNESVFKARGKCLFIVDWHNYAFTIQRMKEYSYSKTDRTEVVSPPSGKNRYANDSLFLKFAAKMEIFFGKKADHHLCVSRAMLNDLLTGETFVDNPITDSARVDVMYDLPLAPKNTSACVKKEEKSEFMFQKLMENLHGGEEQLSKIESKDRIKYGFLFSSTSWTKDEDFSILFDALIEYDRFARDESLIKNETCVKPLICVVTGMGPGKSVFKKRISSYKWSPFVHIFLPWIPSLADYRKVIRNCDLGVSLHSSSSGLDLPMKIVDMFSECLPVAALNYTPALSELVINNKNGFTFRNSNELFHLLVKWFKVVSSSGHAQEEGNKDDVVANDVSSDLETNEENCEEATEKSRDNDLDLDDSGHVAEVNDLQDSKMREYIKHNFTQYTWGMEWSGTVLPVLNRQVKYQD